MLHAWLTLHQYYIYRASRHSPSTDYCKWWWFVICYLIPVATLGQLITLFSPNIRLLAYRGLIFCYSLDKPILGQGRNLVLGGIPSSKCLPFKPVNQNLALVATILGTKYNHIPSIGIGGAAKQPELFCCSASKWGSSFAEQWHAASHDTRSWQWSARYSHDIDPKQDQIPGTSKFLRRWYIDSSESSTRPSLVIELTRMAVALSWYWIAGICPCCQCFQIMVEVVVGGFKRWLCDKLKLSMIL